MKTQKSAGVMMATVTAQYLERFPSSTRATAEAYAREIVLHEVIFPEEQEGTQEKNSSDEEEIFQIE